MRNLLLNENIGTVKERSNFLIVSVRNNLIAFPFEGIKAVIKKSKVFPVPFVPSWVEGVTLRRGYPLLLVHIGALLELEEGEKEDKVVVFETEEGEIGFLVDNIERVIPYEKGALIPLPSKNFLYELKVDGRRAYVVNLEKVMKKLKEGFQ